MSSQEPLTLDQLEETYEIIGEMSGREDARTFMAKRREDGADVLIAVATTPAGDEGNALSHLAADANLLSGRVHRCLLPIVEGRWLGTDAFAIVSEHVNARNLDELLARREEEFDYPRIALILQEVNGLLEWARARKVVHRTVSVNTLYLEPGSDRVLVSFVVRPLPLADMPGAEDDARTIAQLARAMLTRSTAAPERESQPLAELRPNLPARVIEQTDALLALTRTSTEIPDVKGYIAVIAMAEPLKRSETESADTTRRLLEEERIAHEEIEARRQSCERSAAEQQRLFEAEKEAHAKEREVAALAFAKEKEAAQQAFAKERASIAKERAVLLKERAALEAMNADLRAQADLYARTAKVPTLPGDLTPVGDRTPLIIPLSVAKRPSLDWRQRMLLSSWTPRLRRLRENLPSWHAPTWSRAWNIPVGAGALALIIAVSLFALGKNRRTASPDLAATAPAARVVETAAGVTASLPDSSVSNPDSSVSPTPIDVPADLVSGVATRAALAPPAMPRPVPRRVETPVDTSLRARPDTFPRVDALMVPGTSVKTDSVARPKPASVPKRDSIRRDTLIRRDTSVTTPD